MSPYGMRKSLSLLVFAAALVRTGCPAGAADDGDMETAQAHFSKGVESFSQENWEKALREFQAAFNVKPHWKIRYNIGLCYVKLEFWAQAMTEMTLMIEEGGKSVPKAQLAKVTNMIDSIQDKVGKLTLEGDLEGVDIFVDGKPIIGLAEGGVLFLNPGEHRVEVRVKDFTALSEDVVLMSGQAKIMEVKIPAEAFREPEEEEEEQEPLTSPPPAPKKGMKPSMKAGIVLAAAAGAALLGGAGAGINAIVEQKKQQDAYDDYTTGKVTDYGLTTDRIDDHYGRARTSALASTILLSLGGGLAAAALVVFFVPRFKKEKPGAAGTGELRGLALLPGPGSLSLSFSFR
jgi:tetratricopeptide (TPR) repeat protein